MAGAGHPDYESARTLTYEDLERKPDEELLYSYTVIRCNFTFPSEVKYPSIPCYVDETTTVYPLQGTAILTGAEYILARNQGCRFTVHESFYIPFKQRLSVKNGERLITYLDLPFRSVIQELQSKRRMFEKGTIGNATFKELSNSIYGSVVRGMSDKRKFDIKSGTMKRMSATDLTNPIIASWTTGFVRSVIGESLDKIHKLNGKVVSVTTDGFITDIKDFESNLKVSFMFNKFCELRDILSGDDTGYEVKTSGYGVISWSTRGQLGIGSNIKALTGFQMKKYTRQELIDLFTLKMSSSDKAIEYVQTSLRSAKDIYKHGGHVTMMQRDQIFRLNHDNRRIIINEVGDSVDFSGTLLDSKPVKNVGESENLRYLMRLSRNSLYNKGTSGQSRNKYKSGKELIVRSFLKALLHEPPKYNLYNDFKTYSEIITYLQEYDESIKLTKQGLSHLKNRKMIFRVVPRTDESVRFTEFIKHKYPDFDVDAFLNYT